MKYAKINDGTVVEYPYEIGKIRHENPGTSFPSEMPDGLLAEYEVFSVQPTDRPQITSRQYVTEATPAFIEGEWRQQWEILPLPVPSSITTRQCRLVLMAQGLLAQVETMIAAQDEATRITWEYALEFQRDDPLLSGLAANLGLTDAQIDEFFFAASQL